ncbi:50s ribosomal protein l6 [Nautilia profundicola AmH]|uniref:Large ribosomal subunit protein uL6 n=1 Tax=Nautilia profundicola (strain ATCC BAA-1463 / DSM 18972 / AmH) TaxID=598659 RepID=RL6_NAUPA|nr:50S ribosomal protein L6 [Nautilia profundicola]B9L6L8.1 RecName: Full=Large ribosomal subunit protein uL6; AltName: Full=50S ribosomal protein L6 [Nautilia profundicola AmH]ACM92113.1 50s ribosomal protein l6 [Nautilia profundicola AmH]
MSRIGKQPVKLASGLEAKLEGNKLIIKKGQDEKVIDTKGVVKVNINGDELTFEPVEETKFAKAMWGTVRALANNAVIGLTQGFEKKLEINGVGYRAQVKGNILELQLGYSHPINFEIPKGITITVEKNIITVKGSDKQQVGQVASEIRSFRKPEPYKGKGVKYVDEHIIRKAGKTAKK